MPWSFLNNKDQNQVMSELSEREDVGIIGFLRQSLLSPGAGNNDTCESRGKRQDHEFEKSRFRFDQKYPPRVWIPFWIMIRFWISWKKKTQDPFLDWRIGFWIFLDKRTPRFIFQPVVTSVTAKLPSQCPFNRLYPTIISIHLANRFYKVDLWRTK